MKIKCISNEGTYYKSVTHRRNGCNEECCVLPFTIGKVYDAVEIFHKGESIYYNLLDDVGEGHNYQKHSFIKIGELRNKKLEELGI